MFFFHRTDKSFSWNRKKTGDIVLWFCLLFQLNMLKMQKRAEKIWKSVEFCTAGSSCSEWRRLKPLFHRNSNGIFGQNYLKNEYFFYVFIRFIQKEHRITISTAFSPSFFDSSWKIKRSAKKFKICVLSTHGAVKLHLFA